MISRVETATLHGIDAIPVEVQVDVTSGLPSFTIVGLGDAAVLEARDRVRSAVRSSGFEFPNARIVVNLAPAPLRKHGTGFDLPIAAAILTATRQLPSSRCTGAILVGELSLDGRVESVPGLLVQARSALLRDRTLIGPPDACRYMASLPGLRIKPVSRIRDLMDPKVSDPTAIDPPECAPSAPDLSEILGQSVAKRALEIAATGDHNLLLTGPPGTGKSMLARALCGILPPLTDDERIATALVHSVAGLDERAVLAGRRPFRAPHHSATTAGLVGGGSPPRPGEICLAHNGVLFLDELPEFAPAALQCLRQPLETGSVTLVRADGRLTYPSRFTLVAAANPCPCGFLGDLHHACSCPPAVTTRYRNRVGGPLMDRIDIRVEVGRIDPGSIVGSSRAEPSSTVAERVRSARERRVRRLISAGQEAASSGLREVITASRLEEGAIEALTASARRGGFSGRAVARAVAVARTIADIEERDTVSREHLLEALGYRGWEQGAAA